MPNDVEIAKELGLTLVPQSNDEVPKEVPTSNQEVTTNIGNIPPTDEKHLTDHEIINQLGLTLPSPEDGTGEKIIDLINSLGSGVAQNISDLGQAAIWGAHRIIKDLPGESLIDPTIQKEEKFVSKIPLVQRLKSPGFAAQYPIAEKVGEYLDPLQYMIPGLEGERLVSAGTGALKKFGAKALGTAATGGIYGAALTPENRATGGLSGMALGAALGAALHLPAAMTEGIINHLANRSKISGQKIRSPDEVNDLINKLPPDVLKNLNFGSLVHSPRLSQFFNEVLSNIPFSGARTHGENILAGSRDLAQNIFTNLKDNMPLTSINYHLNNTIKKINNNVRSASNVLYDSLKNTASAKNTMVIPSETRKVAEKYLKQHLDEGLAFKLKGDALNDITQAAKIVPTSLDKSGTKVKFNDLLRNIQTYGKTARKLQVSGDAEPAAIMIELQNAAKEDLKNGAKNSGNPKLIDSLKKANDFYRENVAPLKSPSIRALLLTDMPKKDVGSVLLSGENKKIIKHFTPTQKKLIGLQMMKKGIEPQVLEKELANPKKLVSYYDSLKDHKDLLFNEDIQNKFEQLRALNEASKEPALQENKPSTGYRNAGKILRGLPAFMAGGAAFDAGMRTPLILGSLGMMGGARGATKALTSDWLRDAYVKQELPKILRSPKSAQVLPRIATLLAAQNLRNRDKK